MQNDVLDISDISALIGACDSSKWRADRRSIRAELAGHEHHGTVLNRSSDRVEGSVHSHTLSKSMFVGMKLVEDVLEDLHRQKWRFDGRRRGRWIGGG